IASHFLHRAPPPAPPSLSLHDALPISLRRAHAAFEEAARRAAGGVEGEDARPARPCTGGRATEGSCAANARDRRAVDRRDDGRRSEEHTSELQSRENLVCRLPLEKTKE